jgi:hypothetical protein
MFNIFVVGASVPLESSKEKIGEKLGCGFIDQKEEKNSLKKKMGWGRAKLPLCN